jgi:hypothetical protein
MTALPQKIYLTRAEVREAVGGRRQLEHLERESRLTRTYPAGLKRARYLRAQVKQVLDGLGGPLS